MAKSKFETPENAAGPRRRIGTLLAAGLAILLAACATTTEPPPEAPEQIPALPDGTMFAMISVGTDETGAATLMVDLAELLSGEVAREKAIEDGVIEEGEDLPNDFYIDNDEMRMELLHFADEPRISVVSGNDTSQRLEISEDQLWQLWEGEYAGEAVYGIAPFSPIAMDVTVLDGEITEIGAIYLP